MEKDKAINMEDIDMLTTTMSTTTCKSLMRHMWGELLHLQRPMAIKNIHQKKSNSFTSSSCLGAMAIKTNWISRDFRVCSQA